MNHIIFANRHAALVDVPRNMSSDAYGRLQEWFAKLVKSRDSYAVMRSLWGHNQFNGVWYNEELAGPDGASFEVYKLPNITEEQVNAAVAKIKRDFDVVSLRVMRFETLHDIQAEVNRIAAE